MKVALMEITLMKVVHCKYVGKEGCWDKFELKLKLNGNLYCGHILIEIGGDDIELEGDFKGLHGIWEEVLNDPLVLAVFDSVLCRNQ